MIFFGIEVKASRWPWQGYGWRGRSDKITAPLAAGARFGGGWTHKLGIAWGGTTLLVDLVFGSIRFTRARRCPVCRGYRRDREPGGPWMEVRGGVPGDRFHRSCWEDQG